ncbi:MULTISPECIES: MHYT domain-containing protein [Paenibacillus]|uniref:Circadian input-output histidine kinase CikA n=1 Tax=Paenibacillus validus TaxID=44253 RepID=A0A7X2Z9D5_9BACL|nr:MULTISPECIES: MHYT domain-containing protein [Paenibacillus]MUG70769.1 PAS domain S-box protein [Paenibacillus validus]
MEYLHGTYSLPLVLLSVSIAFFSSYCALYVNERLLTMKGRSRAVGMGLGAVAAGLGIWSMHFVGMLAYRLPVEVHYDTTYLILSMLLPVAGVWAALWVMTRSAVSGLQSLAGGLFTGLAIAGMHYTGMAALRLPAVLSYEPYLVVLSFLLAFALSFNAIRLSLLHRRKRSPSSPWRKAGAAVVFGTAIVGVHNLGMLAAQFKAQGQVDVVHRAVRIDEMLLASWLGAAALLIVAIVAVSQHMDGRFALRVAHLNKQRYDSIFEHNPDMVCMFDLNGRLLRTNPAAERVTGYESGAYLGRPFTQFLSRRDSLKIRSCFARALQGTPQTVECTIRHRSGQEIILSTTIVPMIADGKIADIYTISKDITEQKRTEKQLLQAKLEAERVARIKSEFLAFMSHEIRNPLNGVIGMSELLQETALSAEQREYVKIIAKSGMGLLTVIQNILDFTKMESGKMTLNQAPFSLQVTLEETLQLFLRQCQQQELDVRWQLDQALPALVVGDEGRLKQVLLNLIGNAVKFTEKGGIDIHIRQKKREGDRLQLEFTVRDTGIGIAETNLPHLFQPFYQTENTARKHGGTGLGLAISRRLVELMGGTIAVESKIGEGTKVIFTIQARVYEDRTAVVPL